MKLLLIAIALLGCGQAGADPSYSPRRVKVWIYTDQDRDLVLRAFHTSRKQLSHQTRVRAKKKLIQSVDTECSHLWTLEDFRAYAPLNCWQRVLPKRRGVTLVYTTPLMDSAGNLYFAGMSSGTCNFNRSLLVVHLKPDEEIVKQAKATIATEHELGHAFGARDLPTTDISIMSEKRVR